MLHSTKSTNVFQIYYVFIVNKMSSWPDKMASRVRWNGSVGRSLETPALAHGFPIFLWPCIYPFSISADEPLPLKFLMTKRLSKIKKHWILKELSDY